MVPIPPIECFDQLSVERAVNLLSRTVRAPLKVERIKLWVKQFESPEEKTLAWLILRNLIFRTNEQLHSSIRQAMKKATIHFVDQLDLKKRVAWKDALKGHAGLKFYCGPPSLPINGFTPPGKSGELITRLANQQYGIDKQYPSDVKVLTEDERFFLVDDGTYTGEQLETFLQAWGIDFRGRVGIVVAIAHKVACKRLEQVYPGVPLFHGELLTEEMCFQILSQKWIETEQWIYSKSPLEIYYEVHRRNGPFDKGNGGNGYGNIGALVAFEHGVPDQRY